MHIFALGASRNIGYHASLLALARGDAVTYLLRNPTKFEDDLAVKPYIQSGHATLVKGDATSQEDVRKAWGIASSKAPIDLVLFTIGPQDGKFHLLKGVIINPPNLCTISLLNVLRVIAPTDSRPKLAIVSSTGVTTASHHHLPLVMRPIYSWMLPNAFADKRGMETMIHHAVGKEYDASETPGPDILLKGWEDDLPPPGWLKSAVIIRPSFLTDGPMTKNYRAVVGDNLTAYTISRTDVAHFIIEGLLPEWSKYEGNVVAIGY